MLSRMNMVSCLIICTLADLEAGRLGHYKCSVPMELLGFVCMEEDVFLDKAVHTEHFHNQRAASAVLNNL